MAVGAGFERNRDVVRESQINAAFYAVQFPQRGFFVVAGLFGYLLAERGDFFSGSGERIRGGDAVKVESGFGGGCEISISGSERGCESLLQIREAPPERRERLSQQFHVKRTGRTFCVFLHQINRTAKKRVAEKRGSSLRAVLRVAFHADFDITFSPQRRNVVHRKLHSSGSVAIAREAGFERYFPGREAFRDLFRIHFGIGGGGDRLRSEDATLLMMAVAGTDAAPAVDDHVRAIRANHADHIFEREAVPDFQGLLGSFDVAGIERAGEILVHAVILSGGEEFFGADHAELAVLFRADGILAALPARDGEERDVGIESVGQIREKAGPFVIGMRGDEKNAGIDARFINGLDGFLEGLRAERPRCTDEGKNRGEHGKKTSYGFF